MVTPAPSKFSQCPGCGATIEREWTHCWLCGRDFVPKSGGSRITDDVAIVHTATNPAHSNQPRGFSLQSLILFITVAAVALGMYSIAPGVGIPLGIILLLVWARTAAVVHRRESTGGAVEPGEKLRLFLVSFGVSIALCILLFVSGCAAFFFACLATVNYNTSDFSAVWGALIVTVVVWLLFAGRIVWRRWQQDTNDGT